MKFYVLISNFSKAKDALAIFSNEKEANNILKRSDSTAYSIEEHEVKGIYNYPDKVFAAHKYNKKWDVYEFIGLFSDFEEGKIASGKPNLVLGFIPDDRKIKEETKPAYFLQLKVENIKCFKEKQTLNLSKDGIPFQWTVILGDNGTGKTTLLQCLGAILDPLKITDFNRNSSNILPFVSYEFCYGSKISSKTKDKSYTISPELRPRRNGISIAINSGSDFSQNIICYGYGASRHIESNSSDNYDKSNIASLFSDRATLINAEEWLLQADYIASKPSDIQNKAKIRFEKIKNILKNILPDVEDIEITTPLTVTDKPKVKFKTSFGLVSLNNLSLGYKTIVIWMVDLASKLFDRYPDSENPIEEPAIVLIDELDLHLHPKWQREIIELVTSHFKNTQFIVTAHSPLIVQSASNANIILLRKEGDHIVIENNVENIRGWRVDQILVSDLFNIESSRPSEYDELLKERKKILTKRTLTESDKKRLSEIESKVQLPVGETPEEIKAMDLILRVAKKIEKKGAL